MIQEFASYPDWKAPEEDSTLVLWPDPQQILESTTENHRRLSAEQSCHIQGEPLSNLRKRQREDLKLSPDRPVVATGHQTELLHPGVWGKLAMIDAVAKKLDADCLFAAVDSDAPKHLQLRWPGKSAPISDDPRITDAPWCGLLAAPSASHVQDLKSELAAASASWSFTPMIFDLLDDLVGRGHGPQALSTTLTTAMYRLDCELGLQHQSILVSRLWTNDSYLTLANHLLANAGELAAAYNGALREYRDAHAIDDPGRPMPDLQCSPDRCEVPFWLDDQKSNTRQRASVRRTETGWKLIVNGDAFELAKDKPGVAASLRDFLNQHNTRLSPRALTLTMFFRLLIVDQWVHGIGGGRYEQVNDRVIQRFFGIDPPAFSVTTATLYFPEAAGRTRACVPCLQHEGHRLRHAVMGPEKMELVRQIDSLPRRSVQRQRVFSEMHTRLAQAVQIHPSIQTWRQEVTEALERSAAEERVFDRELFYAIQPRERLTGLIDQYAARF